MIGLLFVFLVGAIRTHTRFKIGPTPWPLVGNALTINRNAPGYKAYLQWKKQFLGELPIVAVTDHKLLVDTFIRDGDTFAGRYNNERFTNQFRYGNYGVVDTEGDFWKEQRRFTLHTFRNFGVGKNLMQEKILDEIGWFIDRIDRRIECNDSTVDIVNEFEICVGSIINNILFGYRFDTPTRLREFDHLKNLLSKFLRTVVEPLTAILVVSSRYVENLPVFRDVRKNLMENRDQFFGFFEKQIKQHEQELDFDSTDEPRDYVEAYLRKMRADFKEKSGSETFTQIQLINVLFDLWIAGMETTINTLSYGLICILHNPEVQERLHEELNSVVGSDRLITVDDRSRLPYLSAVINETQRCANVLAQNLFHKTTRDVVIEGHSIPKGTCIIPQISCVLLDPTVFSEPEKFKPQRFLTKENKVIKYEELVPFSIGKRQCLGEALARMELFLIMGNLFNRYKIMPAQEGELPTTEKQAGITVQCYPFKCKMEKRF
ncbi:hypothetical protein L596_003048 [Steinernema carpocapsae]|uniref:Cytochrome P450 n=2 Tax=Steinernema carpocapsae TaxID=34508 RepID=A0A4U8USX5_STECR|nr:hypothetical protein L596_003048 [Steinernema carpocapsae]